MKSFLEELAKEIGIVSTNNSSVPKKAGLLAAQLAVKIGFDKDLVASVYKVAKRDL